ncbi:MAG: PAS domain S-box protein, partial [Fidelibacterota bacterium]
MIKSSVFNSYYKLLTGYVSNQEEKYLLQAEELGRHLVNENIPPEDIIEMHESAIERLCQKFPNITLEEVGKQISMPLMEMLMAYGLAFSKRSEQLEHEITEHRKLEGMLKESEERFRSLYENSTIGLYRTTPDGRILLANPTLVKMLGYSSFEELSSRNLEKDGFEPEYPRDHFIKRVERDEQIKGFENAWKRQDGTIIYIRESARVIRDQNGTIKYYEGTVEDITERKEAEEARKKSVEVLKNSEERLKILFDSAPNAYYLSDLKGTFIDGNNAAEDLIGYKKEELVGKNYLKLKLLSPAGLLVAAKLLAKNLQGESTGPDELILNCKDGSQVTVEIRTHPVQIKNKKLVLGIANDITERKQAEESLRESEEKYRQLFENANEAIHITQDEKFVFANPMVIKITGYGRKELFSISMTDIVHPDDQKQVFDHYFKILEGEKVPDNYDFRIIDKKGELKWLSIRSVLVEWEGKPAVLNFSTDITNRKQAEEELKHRADMELLIANVSSNLVKRSFENIDSTITEALGEIGTFSGVDRAYVFRLHDDTATMENTHEWCAKGIEAQIDNLKDLPTSIFPWWMDQLNHFNIIHIPLVKDLPPEADAEKEILQSQDIQSLLVVPMIVQRKLTGFIGFDAVKCERNWLEEDTILLRMLGETIAVAQEESQNLLKLKESETSFRGIYDNATDAIYVQDQEGRFLDVNRSAVDMYGYPRDYFIGKTPKFLSAPGKNDLRELNGHIEKAFQGEPQQFEFWGKRKNGEIFPKLVRLNKSEYFGQEVIIAFAQDVT